MTVLLSLLLLQGVAASSQDTTQGRPCLVAIDSVGRFSKSTDASGEETRNGGGGVRAHCLGTGTTVSADSFAHYRGPGRLDLIGHVQIRDTAMALDAHFASYFLKDERLEAHNNVVATNRRNGSVLRGPNLKYWRAVKGVRDTVEMYATQRPTVEYRQSPDSGGGGPQQEPYIIVGDRLRFKGDDRMWAGGKVTIDRSDFASRSDSMMLDQTTGFGVLVGKPSVEGRGSATPGQPNKGYTLVGTRIELGLAQRDIRQVKALSHGKVTGADWTLTADTIDLRIANRLLQQTFAWGDTTRPHAVSTLYTILSDSMAIDSPDEVLKESRAFGKAYATAKRDSTTPRDQVDWVHGDSITIRFTQEQDSATKSQHARLQELIARGNARALTHHPERNDSTKADSAKTDSTKADSAKAVVPNVAINYSRGHVITMTTLHDRIDRVVVSGNADGVHLEPRPAVEADSVKRARADSARADSARAARRPATP